MNTLQITKILSNNRFTNNCFRGVFAADKIPTHNTYSHALVANTDKHGDAGTH
jgi:hypothetical protein